MAEQDRDDNGRFAGGGGGGGASKDKPASSTVKMKPDGANPGLLHVKDAATGEHLGTVEHRYDEDEEKMVTKLSPAYGAREMTKGEIAHAKAEVERAHAQRMGGSRMDAWAKGRR